MINLEETAERLIEATTEKDLTGVILKSLEAIGYDNLVVSTFDAAQPRVLQAIVPEGWAETYFSREFYKVDPAYRVQDRLWQPHTWASIVPKETGARVREFIGISEECGLRHGVSASSCLLGRKLNFAISSSHKQEVGFERRLLAVTHMLSAGFASRLSCIQGEARGLQLSVREREVVQWICAGYTNDEIGDRMGISAKTVQENIRRISVKNSMAGRMQIAVAAILSGQVNL